MSIAPPHASRYLLPTSPETLTHTGGLTSNATNLSCLKSQPHVWFLVFDPEGIADCSLGLSGATPQENVGFYTTPEGSQRCLLENLRPLRGRFIIALFLGCRCAQPQATFLDHSVVLRKDLQQKPRLFSNNQTLQNQRTQRMEIELQLNLNATFSLCCWHWA